MMLNIFKRPHEEGSLLEAYVGEMTSRFHAIGKVGIEEDRIWMVSLIKEQDEEGFWGLLHSPKVDGDIRVAYWYEPTYIATACLMKYWVEQQSEAKRIVGFKHALQKGLSASVGRQFEGHGYDSIKGRLKALEIFAYGKVLAFIEDYPDMCMDFMLLIERLEIQLSMDLECGNTMGMWGEDYREDMERVWHLLSKSYPYTKLFVYGTLMKGHNNYEYYLKEAKYLGERIIEDYELYDLGAYPGIVACEGEKVRGELYRIDKQLLDKLDILEGEGVLFKKKQVEVYDENGVFEEEANTYVYNKDIGECEKVSYKNQPWKKAVGEKESDKEIEDYVWYVSYGSNMVYERFLYYIKGGRCKFNQKVYSGCQNKQLPSKDESVMIPYQMYFGNRSMSWGGRGVAFLDVDTPGVTMGRMYLVTKEQFNEIWEQEGKGESWYSKVICIGDKDGIEMLTFTNKIRRQSNLPSKTYLELVKRGLKEAYPTLNEGSIKTYLGETAFEESAIQVLKAIRENPTRLKVADMIQRTGLAKENIYHIIDSLLDGGYIKQDRRDMVSKHNVEATFFTQTHRRKEIDKMITT